MLPSSRDWLITFRMQLLLLRPSHYRATNSTIQKVLLFTGIGLCLGIMLTLLEGILLTVELMMWTVYSTVARLHGGLLRYLRPNWWIEEQFPAVLEG